MNQNASIPTKAGDITQVAIVERWQWYFAALKDPARIGTSGLALHPGHYELGYYRTRAKGGQWEPVGIYPDDDGVDVGFRGDRQVTDLAELFLWSCRNPITHEAYVKALAGDGFDDEPPAPIGDNSGATDPFEALRIEFLGEKEQALEILKAGIKTQADADRASIWKDRILKIRTRAQAMFKAEKQPVTDEGKRIDEKYRALAHEKDGDTSALVERLRVGMEAFMLVQKRAEEERQRVAQREAARIRREAEEAAAKAKAAEDARRAVEADAGPANGRSEAEAAEARREAEEAAQRLRQAEREAEARSVSAGRTGARTSIRSEKKGEIVDYDAFVMAVRNRDEVRELMQSLANRAAKSGSDLPGLKIVTFEKVV